MSAQPLRFVPLRLDTAARRITEGRVAQLLEELRQYAEAPDAELPEDFKWLDHEFAQAIYWGLQEELDQVTGAIHAGLGSNLILMDSFAGDVAQRRNILDVLIAALGAGIGIGPSVVDHEFAQAIYWGLQEELVSDTEETPFNPEEIVTVALLREVLVNFVERCMGLDDFAVTAMSARLCAPWRLFRSTGAR